MGPGDTNEIQQVQVEDAVPWIRANPRQEGRQGGELFESSLQRWTWGLL